MALEKKVVRSAVPETGGPFNLGVTFGPLLFVSGLPPFLEEYCTRMRAARARGERPPPYEPAPFEEQVRIVMDHVRDVVTAAGSNMDCLLKVSVWLKDQTQMETFDRIYRSYFSAPATLPARTRIQAGRMPLDCGLEVEAIGYIPGMRWTDAAPARKPAGKPARKPAAKKKTKAPAAAARTLRRR